MAIWLARNLILTRLKESVAHEFDAKLEGIRAQLRESEEHLKSELRAKETEIEALRSGALTAMVTRQVSVEKRRLEAVDQLWSAATALAAGKSLLTTISIVDFDAALKRAEKEPRLREVFSAMGGTFDIQKLDLTGAAKARPFVSPMAWATYSALVAMIFSAAMRWQMLKTGTRVNLVGDETISKLIKTVLPNAAEWIDKHGPKAYAYIVDQVELKLIEELQQMMAGVEADRASVERAADIVSQSNDLLQKSRGASAEATLRTKD